MQPDNLLPASANQEQQGFFQISQGHLNLLEACPRKFQHVYLDQLGLPSVPEQERQALGARFHQLMQHRELGLPIENLIQSDPQLQRWFAAFMATPPDMLVGDRQSEHRRTSYFQNYLLTGVYDLLILGDQRAQILDWKTYTRPQHQQWLQQNWQTRLYLYLLAETSDYLPEQISMTYWFAESRKRSEPQITFTYDATQHTQTQQNLQRLLGNLTSCLSTYSQVEKLFPQAEIEAGHCDGRSMPSKAGQQNNQKNQKPSWCRFAIRCQRHDSQINAALIAALDDVREVPL